MTDFPDVLGMELHAAKALLEAEGLTSIVKETKPVKKELPEGIQRVIRVQSRQENEKNNSIEYCVVLTVCKI